MEDVAVPDGVSVACERDVGVFGAPCVGRGVGFIAAEGVGFISNRLSSAADLRQIAVSSLTFIRSCSSAEDLIQTAVSSLTSIRSYSSCVNSKCGGNGEVRPVCESIARCEPIGSGSDCGWLCEWRAKGSCVGDGQGVAGGVPDRHGPED